MAPAPELPASPVFSSSADLGWAAAFASETASVAGLVAVLASSARTNWAFPNRNPEAMTTEATPTFKRRMPK